MKILHVGCCQLCWLMHVHLICMLLSRSPSPKIILCICPKERHTLQDGKYKIPSPQTHSCNFLIIFSLVSLLQLANWSYEPHIWVIGRLPPTPAPSEGQIKLHRLIIARQLGLLGSQAVVGLFHHYALILVSIDIRP